MSKQIYEELVAAGAPELPEGYYALVRPLNSSLFLSVRIQIKKERQRLWDKTVGTKDMYFPTNSDMPEVERIASRLTGIWETHLQRTNKVDAYADVRKYIGRHP